MMAAVCVLCVTQNQKDLLRLAIESFRYHNTDAQFSVWIWDNDSTDGAREWALANADRVFFKPGPLGHHHAQALDHMVQEVTTPFVLTLDNDVYSNGPGLARMLAVMRTENAFAVGPQAASGMGSVNHCGHHLIGQPRIDPCYALFRTDQLARLVKHVSFAPYELTNLGKFYDTGGMIRQAAEGCGFKVIDLPDLHGAAIKHYGAMTWASYGTDDATRNAYAGRHAAAMQDLGLFDARLREGTEVVLARYKEPLDWVSAITGYRMTVYDKSGDNIPNAIPLPNVGREAHTYAEHVARRYDTLAELTVFAQGNPFDHVPDFVDQVKNPSFRFRSLGPNLCETGPDGDPSHGGLPNAKLYTELTGKPFPGKAVFSPGAVFVAPAHVLRRYPQAWWRTLADKLAAPEYQGYAPWVMERLWHLLLSRSEVPHFYEKIFGWFSYASVYAQAVALAPPEAHFVEVGAWHGKSAAFMAVEILNSGKKIRFDVVDHFKGSASPGEQFMRDQAAANGGTIRSIFEANLAPVRHALNVVELPSVEAARRYANKSLDFVFIDAGHDEDEVRADIKAWLPKIKPGGVLAGHDYITWPTVTAAVHAELGDSEDRLVNGDCWYYRVPLNGK